MTIPDGTYVVASGRLGQTVRARSMNGAPGYDVQAIAESGEGTAPHFAPDWCVAVAELGVNVCRHPRGSHWCGLLHVAADALARLEAA
jgi:hypothetical protein